MGKLLFGTAATALLAALLLGSGAPTANADTGHPGAGACADLAPAATSCTTGNHDILSQNQLRNTQRGLPGYVGTIESRLTWTLGNANGVRSQTCHWGGGLNTIAECVNAGVTPPFRSTFHHDCLSFDFRTNTPGGDGAFTCAVVHG